MLIERIISLSLIVSASLALGFFWGYKWKQKKAKELMRKVQVLETWKKAVKVLCPKIQDGEDIEIKSDYLPTVLSGIKLPTKEEDEDTKTAELEIANQGNPRDF